MIDPRDRAGDRLVLMLIGGGIIFTVNFIVFTIWRASANGQTLPDMAEVVFGAIIGGSLVKIADVLSALVALATGRQSERLTERLAEATPPHNGPIEATIVNDADEPVPVEEKP